MNVMLLAAGEGTRLRPYTNVLPKPAIPFLTVPLAAHALGFLQSTEIQNLVVNTFHLPDQIHALFHRLPHKAQRLHFSDERGEILGSGGGLGKARSHFLGGGDFIMMNADEVILPENPDILKSAIASHKASGALATLLVMDHPGVGTQFGGVWTTDQNKVLGFGKSAISGSTKAWHFVGVQILSERIFKYIAEQGASNILYDAVTQGISQGEFVQVHPFQGSWFETGNPTDFIEASKKCHEYLSSTEDSHQKQTLTKTLQQFATGPLEFKKLPGAEVLLGSSAKIDSSSKLAGLVVVGHGSSIASGCHLKDVIVSDGVAVPANTEASDVLFI